MSLAGLKDPQARERYLFLVKRRLLKSVRQSRKCKPIFVFGKQRSGTFMLVFAFHRHPEAIVYDEHRSNAHRIRGPELCAIWSTNPALDSPASNPFVTAILSQYSWKNFARLITSRSTGASKMSKTLRCGSFQTQLVPYVSSAPVRRAAGWFDEGVSLESRRMLREVYRPFLSDFDLVCLDGGRVTGSSWRVACCLHRTLLCPSTRISWPTRKDCFDGCSRA